MKGKEIVKKLLKQGWMINRVKGSHHMMYNPKTNIMVPVPCHNMDLPKGTVETILKQTGLK